METKIFFLPFSLNGEFDNDFVNMMNNYLKNLENNNWKIKSNTFVFNDRIQEGYSKYNNETLILQRSVN